MKRIPFLLILLLTRCATGDPEVTPPSITTLEAVDVTLSSATVGGTIESPQSDLISMKGIVWSRNPAPEIDRLSSKTENGPGAGSFTATLTGLGMYKYYVRAYARAKDQVFYGNEVILDITALIPALNTVKKATIGLNAAEMQTTITYTHTLPIIEKGIAWNTSGNPSINSATKAIDTGSGLTFISLITDLVPYTSYYARAYATTELGTFYGNTAQVLILPPVSYGEVTDIDGNVYKTTTVNGKVWMAENLKVTHYNDGTPITPAGTQDQFKGATSGMFIAYDNNATNVGDYGLLYNGYAVTDAKNVCMTGWHLPSPAEWVQLANNLGGLDAAGGRLKAVSGLWLAPNVDATNESGFSAIPGGSYCRVCLSNTGIFADKGTDSYWWSSSIGSFYYVTNDQSGLRTRSTGNINDGLSVRCVKD